MKITQRLSLGFAAIVTPITFFSVFTISSIKNELKEVGNFHSPNLYLMQNYATKTTEAVEESFAYVASGDKSEKETFLVWAERTDLMSEELKKIQDSISNEDVEKTNKFKIIIQQQKYLIKKAKEMFKEFESKGSISNKLFLEYKVIINSLAEHFTQAIEIEKKGVDAEQKRAVKLIEQTLINILEIGFLTIGSAILSGYFIARSISKPVNRLKLATIEVANGNLDTLIKLKSKDEIGDLAISFSRMIEDIKKYRDNLLSAKKYTSNILKSMNETLIVISPEGSIITINNAACKMLKYEEFELIGQQFRKICAEEELPFKKAKFNNLIENSFNSFETIYLAKYGDKIPVSFSRSLLLNEEQEIEGIVCVAQDITERKRAEAEINNALKTERELNELKSRFITMASHEFRTPLATILSSIELLEHYSYKWSEEKKIEHFHRVQTAVNNMTQLLNDVLLIGKAEAGKVEYKPTLLNLGKLCQDITEEVQAIAGKNYTLTFSSVGQSNDVFIDEKLLQHILTNLLTNAVKYSPEGGPILFNLICDREAAVLSIQDRGIGIPPEDEEKLFESFHRGTNVSTIPGTGLGLAIVKKSVDLHGGKITVESEVEVGTIFTVTLPLHKQV